MPHRVIAEFADVVFHRLPVCSWAIDEQYRFSYVKGDTSSVFDRLPEELTGRTISEVMCNRIALRWALTLERVFAGEPVTELLSTDKPESHFFITYLPGKNQSGQTRIAVGYALRPPEASMISEGGIKPSQTHELEESRLRIRQFLHDDLAQALTAAGLQLDLLRLDVEERDPDLALRTTEIQHLLDDTLRRVRDISSSALK